VIAAAALGLASFCFTCAVLLVARRELRALEPVAPRPLASVLKEGDTLTVVIPARNEPDIAACMEAALEDAHPALRVLVVDDRSTDDTASRARAVCARDARAELLSLADDPPPDVFGKPRALAAGVAHLEAKRKGAPAGLLLFLDADVWLEKGALGALVEARARSGADALSGVPRLETSSALEDLLVPTLTSLVTSRFLPTRVHDARAPVAFLNGQLILIDGAALAGVGGWSAVQDTVLEDVALARRLKGAGRALRLADVRSLASTRMYEGLAEIVEGFGKNAVALLGPAAGLFAVLSFVTSCLPWVVVAAAIALPGELLWRALALVCALGAVGCAVLARRLARVAWWPALVLPLSYAAVSGILLGASWRHLRRAPVQWKGRRYPPRP
jgi:cellulose synthase/poly-beta-1,6-N-acetylglucosamine synthase-like glycosyltransferase